VVRTAGVDRGSVGWVTSYEGFDPELTRTHQAEALQLLAIQTPSPGLASVSLPQLGGPGPQREQLAGARGRRRADQRALGDHAAGAAFLTTNTGCATGPGGGTADGAQGSSNAGHASAGGTWVPAPGHHRSPRQW
jgi:hypothetical protein